MDYSLAVENAPEAVSAGTSLMLLHPSTGETDRLDTDFFKTDTDHLFILSTRTTAREVKQKLEYYEVDESKAVILDTLSIERGYSRRSSDNVRYVSSPDDLDGMVNSIQEFLDTHDGKRRISIDSVTEMAYYADEERARNAIKQIIDSIEKHNAVGIFHVAEEVHSPETIDDYRELFDGVIDLAEDGTVTFQS
jgi:KaiC/GvpD/RAD55 family RecA-like ATPase